MTQIFFLALLYVLGIVLTYQNAKPIEKGQLNVFMTERYISRLCIMRFQKKVQDKPQEVFCKKEVLKHF